MERVIYRLIKKYFGIKGNPKNSQAFEFFNVNLNEITMEQLLRLRKICKVAIQRNPMISISKVTAMLI